jgi:MoaA/NifB/PqqE/SkfB family radical SAM enzyme
MAHEGNICGLLNLTVKCNQNCLFCCDGDVKDSGYHLTFDEARERVAQIASEGASSITFIGGEPLVQKYLPDLVRFSREEGLRVGLTTNGTLLTRERLTALISAGLTSLEISIHSFDPQRSERISRGKGTAAKQLRALELLKSLQGKGAPGLSINFVLFERNYKELPDFTRRVVADFSFVDELFINFLDPIGYPAHDNSLLPTYSEVQPYLLEALEVVAEAGLSFTVDSVPGCMLGPYALFLRATREKLRGVRYAKQTLRIENSAPEPDLSQYYRVNACHDCPISGLCPGVNFRYLGIRGEAEFRPFPVELLEGGKVLLPAEAPKGLAAELGDAGRQLFTRRRQRETLRITARCNNNCKWCGCTQAGGEPSPARLAKELGRLVAREMGPDILLTGGEPAVHPRFPQFIRHLAQAGRRVGFTTNGRVYSYERWVRKVVDCGATFVEVQFPAPPGVLSQYVQDDEAEGQVLQGLTNLLRERKLHVTARLFVPSGTAGRVETALELFAEHGIYHVVVECEEPVESNLREQWVATATRLALEVELS